MTALAAAPVLAVLNCDVAELLLDLDLAGIHTSVVAAPLWVDLCGCCPDRAPGDLDAGTVFEAVAEVHHHTGGFRDCTTPVCALCLESEVAWWVRHGRVVTVTAYGQVAA